MFQAINDFVLEGYVPISVNIKYDQAVKKYSKKPCVKGWENITLNTYKRHLKNDKDIGILTGHEYNLLVIDIDVGDDGLSTWNKWLDEYGIEDTVIVKTPTGGYHYYFTCSKEEAELYKTSRRSFIYNGRRVGIDIRCDGGFVVAPPSKQGDKKYTWVNSFKNNLFGCVPEWLKQYRAPVDNNFSYTNIINNSMNMKIINFSEEELSQYFLDNNKDVYKVSYNVNCEFKQLFEWDDNLNIYRVITKNMLALSICKFYKKIKDNYNIDELVDDKEKMREFQKVAKFVRGLGGRNKMINLASISIDALIIKGDNYNDKKEMNIHLLNFRNGCYDLKNNEFRQRTKQDYVSVYLDYDYKQSREQDINKVKDIITNISNDDPETLGFMLNYLGYCLTGETKAKKFLILYGASASNGKTTLQQIFSKCLKDYAFKIDRKTFNYNYDQYHKQLIESCRPKRMIFLEELDKNKLDISKIKEFVDGEEQNCKIMYGTSDLVKIDAKLIIATNNSPVFDTDEGIQRRGIIVECKNRFVDKDDYEKLKGKKGIHLKDYKIMDLFDDDKYRRAFINLLIPYAVKFYKHGLVVPNDINNAFKDLCDENDMMKLFINNNFEITHDENDRIGKNEFTTLYNEQNRTKLTFRHLVSDIRRLDITYSKAKRCNSQKGCLVGIRYIDFNNDSNNIDNDMMI